MDESVKYIKDLDEYKKLVADGTAIVYIGAKWCGPCSEIKPIFENWAKQNPNTKFIRIDADEGADIADEEKQENMPTFYFYKNGKKVDEFPGSKISALEEYVKKYVV